MDVLQLGVDLLKRYFGDKIDAGALGGALAGLLGDGGKIDLGALVGKLTAQGGGLQSMLGSWLGDGPNMSIDPATILSLFGGDKVSAFADRIGVGRDEAAGGLAEVLPQIVDRFSKGGSLLEASGGLSGMMDMARKLF